MQLKCTIAYDGSRFDGFAPQPYPTKTVIGTLEQSLKALGINTTVLGAGRTDKDVHATGQVISFLIPSFWESRREELLHRLDDYLAPSIMIKNSTVVSDDFHPRFHATSRTYRYLLTTKPPSPFQAPYVTYVKNIDHEKIITSLPLFQGDHDFEYFKKNDDQITSYRRIMYKSFGYTHKDLLVCHFEAQGFLRSQIRMMVDFLLAISQGKLSTENLIAQRDKKEVFLRTLAPANGLYLSRIRYGDDFEPQR